MFPAFLISMVVHILLLSALLIGQVAHKKGTGDSKSGDKQHQAHGDSDAEKREFEAKRQRGEMKEPDSVEVSLIQLPKKKVEAKKTDCKDSYGGVGLRTSGPYVVEVAPGYAADRAGIQPGDQFITDASFNYLRGEPGTHVLVIVDRKGQQLSFDIVREKICMKDKP